MKTKITTLEEARAYRYCAWAGMPKGSPYCEGFCCEEVTETGRGGLYHQCRSKNGHGPAGLYCKRHDPAVVEKREAATRERQNKKWDAEMLKAKLGYHGPVLLAFVKDCAAAGDAKAVKLIADLDL